MNLPFAEDVGHYWQTGQSSPDVWMARTRQLIEDLGGAVLAEGFGSIEGHGAYMLAFRIEDIEFKAIWPILPTKSGRVTAARRQAATMLYHDIKAKAMTASVLGTKTAFFSYLMLPDGRVASELADPELSESFPLQLKSGVGEG